MTGSLELLEAMPQPETEHAAPPQEMGIRPGELRVLRYLPSNLCRPEIASELSVWVVNTCIRNVCASSRPRTVPRPCSARESPGCFRRAFRGDRKITWSRRCRVTCHPEILASWTSRLYVFGTATVWRIGFGAM
jgi:hypothetical protein